MSGKLPVHQPRAHVLELLAQTGQPQAALAIITATHGPAYRLAGTAMLVLADGRPVGALSSGCIEADIARQAVDVIAGQSPKTILYGEGSPYLDLKLPCGGALEVLLTPAPPLAKVQQALKLRALRQESAVELASPSGTLIWKLIPDLQFLVLGEGPEADCFAGLVDHLGFPPALRSAPAISSIDRRTAVTFFFHDHDGEAVIMAPLLASPAFYIGAQGSLRASQQRATELAALGVSPDQLAHLHAPIGLVPSTRDPAALAVSTMAQILQIAQERGLTQHQAPQPTP
jgi:xanthine dehydrogenase accessory factor